MKYRLLLWFLCLAGTARAQEYSTAYIFSHNDYVQADPFHTAYRLQAGYIEADVFLQQDELLVAHTRLEIKKNKTLESLYLKPLQQQVLKNEGYAYADHGRPLTLMIDLKTDGVPTLGAIVKLLEQYPEITTSPTLRILISGDVPSPAQWKDFPAYVFFDGRPGKVYTDAEWERVGLVSTNFKDHVRWNGTGPLPAAARDNMLALMNVAHQRGKKFRFWATPDVAPAWRTLLALPVDMLVTDHVPELAAFLAEQGR